MAPPTPSVVIINYVPDEREMYAQVLRAAGATMETCEDADAGFAAAVERRPDVVITRLGRGPNGLELARRLKEHPEMRGTAVAILSSLFQPDYRDAATAAGCDAYILLPCTPDEVVAVVQRLAQRGGAVPM